MISFSVSEARQQWAHVIKLIEDQKEHIFITRRGKVVAVMIPCEDATEFLYNKRDENNQLIFPTD